MIQPKKQLGQNFLQDPNTIRKIVAAVEAPAGAQVVEIGPGMGALTELLDQQYDNFTAIEIDPRAVEYLLEKWPNLKVIEADILKTNWHGFTDQQDQTENTGKIYVVGNLPYYITSQILFSMLDRPELFARAVVMMQYEVAQRLVAVPRTKAYGILSVITQLYSNPQLLFKVSPHVFYPKPGVNSAIVGLDFIEGPAGVKVQEVRRVVRMAFNQRRKTLRNSLKAMANEKNIAVPEQWASLRAEALTPGEFVALTEHFFGTNDE